MEKLPFGKRPEPKIVGRGSEETKEEALEDVLYRFGEGHFDQTGRSPAELKREEREKTKEETEAIRAANEITNEVLRSFRLKEFDIPAQNVHFLNREIWEKAYSKDADAPYMATAPKTQAIIANGSPKETYPSAIAALGMFHEFIHLKGQLSVEVDSEESKDLYRSGLVTYSTYKKFEKSGFAQWFDGLNEAVVTEMEAEYADRVLGENQSLKSEVAWLGSAEAKELIEKYAKEHKTNPSEVRWISQDGQRAILRGYREQRKVLSYVVDQIYADGGFRSREDVMRLFFEAHFKHTLLPIGRLVEKAFGKGSFRELGSMDRKDGSASAGRVLDSLMRHRRLIKTRKQKDAD